MVKKRWGVKIERKVKPPTDRARVPLGTVTRTTSGGETFEELPPLEVPGDESLETHVWKAMLEISIADDDAVRCQQLVCRRGGDRALIVVVTGARLPERPHRWKMVSDEVARALGYEIDPTRHAVQRIFHAIDHVRNDRDVRVSIVYYEGRDMGEDEEEEEDERE